MQYLGYTYIKLLYYYYTKNYFVVYLKFRFNWVSCILSEDFLFFF